jgi:hypothetical protein
MKNQLFSNILNILTVPFNFVYVLILLLATEMKNKIQFIKAKGNELSLKSDKYDILNLKTVFNFKAVFFFVYHN